jgi:hypothetical protein
VTTEAHFQSAKDSEHSVDEGQTASQRQAEERDNRSPSEAADSARPEAARASEAVAQTASEAAAQDSAKLAAGDPAQLENEKHAAAASDASSVSAGTAEAAEIGAAARGNSEPIAAQPVKREKPLTAARASDPLRELDLAQADRFAASIRPSWSDAPAVPVSRPPAVQAIAPAGGARVIRHNTRTDLNLRLRKRRGSAYAILGASLLGVFGLLYLGISSSTIGSHERGLSPRVHEPKPASPQPQPQTEATETSVHAAQAPEPAAAAQVEPQLAAAQPGEPALADEKAPQATTPEPGLAEPELKAPDFAAAEPRDPSNTLAALAAPAAEPEPAAEPAAAEPAAAEPEQPAAAAPSPQPTAALAAAAASPATKTSEKAPQPSAAAAPAVAAQKLAAARPADRNKVLLDLAAYPPNTRLRLDGMLVENPYRVRVPKSSKHRIDAAAPGYTPESHVVRMDADVQLMMSLKREQVRDVKADPYAAQRRSNPAAASGATPTQKRERGAGFVAENPY